MAERNYDRDRQRRFETRDRPRRRRGRLPEPGRGYPGESPYDRGYGTEGYYGTGYVRETDYGRGDYSQYGYGYQGTYAGRAGAINQGSDIGRESYYAYNEAWGTAGPFTGRGPQGYQRSDERIKEDVNERLTRHGQVDASDIQVAVENGEVTLLGMVEDRRSKRMAEDAVETIPGIVDIHNRLRLRGSEK